MYTVSFTGPKHITPAERDFVWDIVMDLAADRYVSGAAHGVDTSAIMAARLSASEKELYLAVPQGLPHNEKLVTLLQDRPSVTVEYVVGGYMKRNDRLVELADALIAFPKTHREILRSGTWATIRRAENAGVTVELYPLSEA